MLPMNWPDVNLPQTTGRMLMKQTIETIHGNFSFSLGEESDNRSLMAEILENTGFTQK
jgi:hypothetical protein